MSSFLMLYGLLSHTFSSRRWFLLRVIPAFPPSPIVSTPSKCIFFSSSLFRDNCLYILILGISSNNSYILEDALWDWGIDNSDFLQSALQRLKTGILASPSTWKLKPISCGKYSQPSTLTLRAESFSWLLVSLGGLPVGAACLIAWPRLPNCILWNAWPQPKDQRSG
jgi:hypothetical protein